MPKRRRKKNMRKPVIVKIHPSYPTPAEHWQTVQVRCDPTLREQALPSMLSDISSIPEVISKWMDGNCRFAIGEAAPAVQGAPAVGSVPAAPAQGETTESTDADQTAAEAKSLISKWTEHLGKVSSNYFSVVNSFNSASYARASANMLDIVQLLQGPMRNTAGLMIKNTVLQAHKDGDIKNDLPDADQVGRELTGMDAIQMALYNLATEFGGGGPLGFLMNLESQLSAKSTIPILKNQINPNVIQALTKAN